MRSIRKLFNKMIEESVEQAIARRSSSIPQPVAPPEGYNTAEALRGALFSWVLVPFNGVKVWCKLRSLNQVQLDACGVISLIGKHEKKEYNTESAIEIRNIQEAIAKAVLVVPTFDEILKLVTGEDFAFEGMRKRLDELKAIDTKGLSLAEKKEYDDDVYKAEMMIAFFLPEDTFGFLTEWALCLDKSQVKVLSEDMLLEAAILAKHGSDSPSDHLRSGVFTDRDRNDIDRTAWSIYADFVRNKRIESEAGTKE